MTTQAALDLRTYYSGTAAGKLAVAQQLYTRHAARLITLPLFQEELARLQHHAQALGSHMQSMHLGQICSHCAAHANGGCCSAVMADNTDALLLLINLLLGIKVTGRTVEDASCRFLGAEGCLFLIKPIFCLNYNCTHIFASAESAGLEDLYRLAAALLSQQTRVETWLLEALRHHDRTALPTMPPTTPRCS